MRKLILLFPVLVFLRNSYAQDLSGFLFSGEDGLLIESVLIPEKGRIRWDGSLDFFSFRINDSLIHGSEASVGHENDQYILKYTDLLNVKVKENDTTKGASFSLEFTSTCPDTLVLENVVPFGENDAHVYITASGPPALARAQLFRPGKVPVSIILPDNAWEMGYGSVTAPGFSVCAITRRTSAEGCIIRRYSSIIPPGRSVFYELYADTYQDRWQDGLKLMFHDRYLFDLDNFDNHLYQRPDLDWIKDTWIISLLYAWDHSLYDPVKQAYRTIEYLDRGAALLGGYDVLGIWPTWPRLGVDERNQWDLYRDLPGGLPALRFISDELHSRDARMFIAYNPWDRSTRDEDHMSGMASIIKATDADGVILDTRGKSSAELQETADRVKQGVVMYSEGMAVTADMPGIISGRVHNAIFLQPILNMNRIIKPDFSVFRVCHIIEGRLHREAAISFFNGTGTEIISFGPGRPSWLDREYIFLGKTSRILRENSSFFKNTDWTPLVETGRDSIWVNQWQDEGRRLYSVFSLIPEGYRGTLIPCDPSPDKHFVSLWHHSELQAEQLQTGWYLPVETAAFNKAWLGTRQEGAVDCVAEFNRLLDAFRMGDSLRLQASAGDRIYIWKGDPSYQEEAYELPVGIHAMKITDIFDKYEGKLVVQLFRGKEILDERVLEHEAGKPWLASVTGRTGYTDRVPEDMILVSGTEILLDVGNPDQFIPYPEYDRNNALGLKPFLMDRFPVTNRQFYDFIQDSRYVPDDTTNFLRHWVNGKYLPGQANQPVVYLDHSDARTYAAWAGKRLPSEAEWQLAAQGRDGRKWPWGEQMEPGRCNPGGHGLTDVDAYPLGSSLYGVQDLVGNVWQLTGDVYENGSYTFVIIRGGSYFNPDSSWWYVKGGPQPLDRTQMLLLMSPGYNRCSTVGFRCVKDIMNK